MTDQEKAAGFVKRLMQNPALSYYTPLQKEDQIIQFLQINAAQLAPTLMSPSFFPNKNWPHVLSMLLQALNGIIDQEIEAALPKLLQDRVPLAFLNHFKQSSVNTSALPEAILRLIKEYLKRNDARRAFTGPLAAIQFDIANRYVDQAFFQRSYVHFELTKVQRLRMSKEEIVAMVNLSLLMRPVVYLLSSENSNTPGETGSGIIQAAYAEKVVKHLKKNIPALPEPLAKAAINSNLSFGENKFIEATARLTSLFAARCRNYHPQIKVDRGADTPDKSWFSIARKNYKFYGFDIKMVDELYKVAAENRW